MRERSFGAREFSRVGLLVLCALLLGACRGAVPPFVIGPVHPSSPPAAYQAVLDGIRAQGYEPQHADPRTGLIVVPSRLGYRGTFTINVQCYQGGWVQVTPSGAGVHSAGRQMSLPSRFQNEIGTFAERLQLRLRGIRG